MNPARVQALLHSPFSRHVRQVWAWLAVPLTVLLPVLFVVVLAVWWAPR